MRLDPARQGQTRRSPQPDPTAVKHGTSKPASRREHPLDFPPETQQIHAMTTTPSPRAENAADRLSPFADIVVHSASALTMDDAAPRASAVAISANRITAIGSRETLANHIGPSTQVIDAAGKTLLPGFVESHLHLFSGAYGRKLLQLGGMSGFAPIQAAVRAFAMANPSDGLLMIKGADYAMLGQNERITRHHLDQMVADQPLLIFAFDHHTAWANTIALEKAGILQGREVGTRNEIVMGTDGLASGELRENPAIGPVVALRTSGGRETLGFPGIEPGPDHTPQQRRQDIETLKDGLCYCAECGITALHNMDGNWYQLELLREIQTEGDLLCRVEIPFHLTPEKTLSSLKDASAMARDYATDMLKSGRVKMFMDGVLESGTAVMINDYGNQPGWCGEPLFSGEAFNQAAIEIDRRGLQISVHAIGDGAVRMVLDGYDAARKANGTRDSRHRIEHIEVVHPDDIPRFAEMGVIAAMQPPHPPGSMGLPLEPGLSAIGPDRWPFAYAWRTLWNADAHICFASDWPVSPIEPILGIHAAVTRKPWSDTIPDQSASLHETLAAYTLHGAYANFMETKTGCLKPGMLADLVLLSDDIENIPLDDIPTLYPVLTICDGRISFKHADL
jgi:predicted amidohydrolase YtcJ